MRERKKAEPLSDYSHGYYRFHVKAKLNAKLMHDAIELFSSELPEIANMGDMFRSEQYKMWLPLFHQLLNFNWAYTQLTQLMSNPLDREDYSKVAEFYRGVVITSGIDSNYGKRVNFVGIDGSCDGSVALADMIRELAELSTVLEWLVGDLTGIYNQREV